MNRILQTVLSLAVFAGVAGAQTGQSASPSPDVRSAEEAFSKGDWQSSARLYGVLLKQSPHSPDYQSKLGISLAKTGRCEQALPYLRKTNARGLSDDLKKTVGQSGIRCAMAVNRQDDAVAFLTQLRREFPKDADILFLSVHVFSDLSVRASQELLFTAPGSYQVHELNAEALETQGRWDDAMSEYRAVLEKNPSLPGIHYRIGRLLLSKPSSPAILAGAKKEFEAELKIDPRNAGAEYVLGEVAREQDQWPNAVSHFERASQLDNGFADAFIGLGRSLMGAGRNADAIAPLQHAVKLQPGNPAAHYHLALAFQRTGQKELASQQFTEYQQAQARAGQLKHSVQEGVLGPQQVTSQDK